jgi:glycosyltransferase involved in cell wall biosynthesis
MKSVRSDVPIKMLLVSPCAPPYGGVSHGTIKLLEWLKDLNNVQVALLDTSPRWRGIDDTNIALRFMGGFIFGSFQLYRFIKLLITFHPNIVYLRSSASLSCLRDFFFVKLALRWKIRAIYALHMGRIPELERKRGWEWRYLTKTVKSAWRTVVLDKASFAALSGAGFSTKIALIPNALDPEHFITMERQGSGANRVIFLGWIIPAKGLSDLIIAWNRLRATEWELLIVGPGKESFVAELRGNANPDLKVVFTGEIAHEEAMKYLKDSDVLVLPSHTEGLPNVILEAMAFRIPVVASRVGAIPEVVAPSDGRGCCGLIIDAHDPQGIEEALRKLIGNPELRNELGENGRTRILQEYSTNVIHPCWLDLWSYAVTAGQEKLAEEGKNV